MTQQSYLTVEEATELLTNTIGAESWMSLTDTNKNASLIQASFLLDSNFPTSRVTISVIEPA